MQQSSLSSTENTCAFGSTLDRVRGLVSKFKTNWWLKVSALIVLWSFAPLLINFNSYPPGDDPIRLELLAERTWFDYKYFGFWPIKLLGVSLYYYLTPLLSYLGLLFFFGMKKRWSAVIAMGLIYGLIPAIYFNLGAGTWISVINFMLVGLITVKVVYQLGSTRKRKYVLPAIILTFILPLIHNETGIYFAIMVIGSIILTRNWRISYLLLSTFAGLYLTFGLLGAEGKSTITSAIGQNQVHQVIEVITENGDIYRIHVTNLSIGEIVPLNEKENIKLTETNFKVQNVRLAWWSKFMLTENYVPFTLLTLAIFLYFSRTHFAYHKPSLMLLTALPIMMFFAWTPWEISGIRIGIYIAVILAIFHASVLGQIIQDHKDEWLKFTLTIVGGFYFIAGSSNTWISWLFARA